MAVSDLFDMLDAFIPDDKDDGDDDVGSKSASNKETHLSLWKRANLAVKVLIREGRKDEATKCILAFFRDFEDLDELGGVTKEIEDLITRPVSRLNQPEPGSTRPKSVGQPASEASETSESEPPVS